MKSLTIIGRRWFNKGPGNTYNTATILIDGKLVHKTELAYGYGDHFVDIAGDWLEANGYMPEREHNANGSKQPLWQYFRDDRKVEYYVETLDVPRRKDL